MANASKPGTALRMASRTFLCRKRLYEAPLFIRTQFRALVGRATAAAQSLHVFIVNLVPAIGVLRPSSRVPTRI
jgi:hypothetical protein